MVLLGVFVLVAAQDVRPASIADPIGSKGAPRFVGIILLVGGAALVLRRLSSGGANRTLCRPRARRTIPAFPPDLRCAPFPSGIVDDVTRECLAAIPDTSISGRRVARELTMLIETRGKPG